MLHIVPLREMKEGDFALHPREICVSSPRECIGFKRPYLKLDTQGFDITSLYPVNRDNALRLVEFDCVVINRTAIRIQGPDWRQALGQPASRKAGRCPRRRRTCWTAPPPAACG